MKPFRWLAAGLVWVLASVVGLLGVLLCVTLVLIPLGLLVLSLSRRLYGLAGRLMLPRALRHPISEGASHVEEASGKLGKKARRLAKQASPRRRKILGLRA